MRHHRSFAAVLLLNCLFVAACSPTPPPPLPEQNARLVYPDLGVPLDCADAPLAPSVDADDRDWAGYKAKDHDAGQECRDRLRAVKGVVAKWPKATDQVPK